MPKKEVKDLETRRRSLVARKAHARRRSRIAWIVLISFLVVLALFAVYVLLVGPSINSYVTKVKNDALQQGLNQGIQQGMDMAKQNILHQFQQTQYAQITYGNETVTLFPWYGDRQLNLSN